VPDTVKRDFKRKGSLDTVKWVSQKRRVAMTQIKWCHKRWA